jgi:25S rRNA (uracil2634-N3)-methyltransferase
MGKKTNLKATFSNFQEKQKQVQLQKSKEAARKAAVKQALKPSSKSKGKRPAQQIKTATIPFAASDTILLIGEGNFSFALALFTSGHDSITHLVPSNVTATTYDSEEACYEKYPDAQNIVKDLRQRGVIVLFDVDARRLNTYKELKKRRWKRIIWNFPHAGAFNSLLPVIIVYFMVCIMI